MLYPHKSPFSKERRVGQLKSTLESIQPPTGDEPGKITTLPGNEVKLLGVIGAYTTKFDCATLEAHYKEEFAKHGFSYTEKAIASSKTGKSISFTSRDYNATLNCTEISGPSRPYLIIIWSNVRG
jgi:hypothetical protein